MVLYCIQPREGEGRGVLIVGGEGSLEFGMRFATRICVTRLRLRLKLKVKLKVKFKLQPCEKIYWTSE